MANPGHNYEEGQRDPGRSCYWVMALGDPTSGVPGSCDDSPTRGRLRPREKRKGGGKVDNIGNRNYSTRTSRVATHRTTIQPGKCLTSQIRRDAVFSRL